MSDPNEPEEIKQRKAEKRRGIPRVKTHGDFAHNGAFLVTIGDLVVNWANNESVFKAILQVLMKTDARSASIVWSSHRNTLQRLELVNLLCRERVADEQLTADLCKAIENFKGLSRSRNFYCHAMYVYGPDRALEEVVGTTLAQTDDPIRFERKVMDLATLNEIINASVRLGELNQGLWKLVDRLQKYFGVQLVVIPELLLARTRSPDGHPHSSEGEAPGEQPKSPVE